jgi:tetratricopeptide (TPR) repeat protein
MSSNIHSAAAEFAAARFRLADQFALYVLARDPINREALRIHGLASLRLGRFSNAIAALEHLALLRPLQAEEQTELAVAHAQLGDNDLACELLMSLATTGTPDLDQLLTIAAALEAMDEPHLAMEVWRRSNRLALDAEHRSSRKVSEALIEAALNLPLPNIHLRIGLASILLRLDREAEAESLLAPVVPDRLGEIKCWRAIKRIAPLLFHLDRWRADRSLEQLSERELTPDGEPGVWQSRSTEATDARRQVDSACERHASGATPPGSGSVSARRP